MVVVLLLALVPVPLPEPLFMPTPVPVAVPVAMPVDVSVPAVALDTPLLGSSGADVACPWAPLEGPLASAMADTTAYASISSGSQLGAVSTLSRLKSCEFPLRSRTPPS